MFKFMTDTKGKVKGIFIIIFISTKGLYKVDNMKTTKATMRAKTPRVCSECSAIYVYLVLSYFDVIFVLTTIL